MGKVTVCVAEGDVSHGEVSLFIFLTQIGH